MLSAIKVFDTDGDGILDSEDNDLGHRSRY